MTRCGYCKQAAELVNGLCIYPHRQDLAAKKFWFCRPCDAWVGCHDGTDRPLGRLADSATRRARNFAHQAFDPIWRDGCMKRKAAYRWLASRLRIPLYKCHIALFDVDTCNRVVAICEAES